MGFCDKIWLMRLTPLSQICYVTDLILSTIKKSREQQSAKNSCANGFGNWSRNRTPPHSPPPRLMPPRVSLPLSSNCCRCSAKQTVWSEHCDCDIATVFFNGGPSYSFGHPWSTNNRHQRWQNSRIDSGSDSWSLACSVVFGSPECLFKTKGWAAPIRFCHKKPIQYSLISRHTTWYHTM